MSQMLISSFLRRVLLADAAVSLAAGAVMVLGGAWLQGLLQLPALLLVPSGLSLFGYAALLGWLARRASVRRDAVWLLVVGNLAWAVACLAIAAGVAFAPSVLGQAFLGAQVIAVLVFAELQFMALRRAGAARGSQGQLA
ncbi:MAG: hypothetical protein H7Y33_01295 [Cytophagales bacterium]|nr:hypothetical protein [Rhizobacter sp.]